MILSFSLIYTGIYELLIIIINELPVSIKKSL